METLFGPQAAVETSFHFEFGFMPTGYAPHWNYVGYPHQFDRHYYAPVGELKNKGEEYECAKALDMTGSVKHWVRNLDRRGFWLPVAERKFYPDFVAELVDGRTLVVEHKGEIYATNDDSKDKCNIGALWEENSAGKALFLMTVVEKGKPTLFEQMAAKIHPRTQAVGAVGDPLRFAAAHPCNPHPASPPFHVGLEGFRNAH